MTAMGKRLVAEGCGRYEEGPGPDWTDADRKSYTAWQHKLGYRGKDADGVPGKVSRDRLKVPASRWGARGVCPPKDGQTCHLTAAAVARRCSTARSTSSSRRPVLVAKAAAALSGLRGLGLFG
ncbi:peptidoglycan-binding protein [Streptomyces sp. NPDC058239]|uniref:peptidoglycan-binding protein n=1 Tax=unclassified Streptomyces TaxID=2593676 RepID=UPI00365EA0FC